jgi:hypothetical protein
VLGFRGDLKVLGASRPIDFRRGIHGLVAMVAEALDGLAPIHTYARPRTKKLCDARAAYWLEKPDLFVTLGRRLYRKKVLRRASAVNEAPRHVAQPIVITRKREGAKAVARRLR